MKALLNTIILALTLSTTAMAETPNAPRTPEKPAEKTAICECQSRIENRNETMQKFLQEMRSGQLSQPGIVIEDAGQSTT